MSSKGKVSILIVDDRPDKMLALEAVLEDLNLDIARAYSGREALRHVLAREFAVILLDVNMPDMDGFETAQLIRQRPSSAHVPIIFLTAMSDEMHVARGYSLGAVDYILTPVVPQVLQSKVSVFVDLFKKNQQVEKQAHSLGKRTLQLQKLASASVSINAALSIEKMLQTITDAARDVIGAHQAITVLMDPRPGQRIQRTQSIGSYSDKYAAWRSKPLDLSQVPQTVAAQSRTATRLTEEELRDHPDWEIVRQLPIPPIEGGVLAAPLTSREGINLGIIYLCDGLEGAFSADDEALLVQLAQMASIAIENTLFAEEREVNRLKEEFLSTLSHELRTPMNAIAGWVQLLQMDAPEGEMAHGLEVIQRNVVAQTRLIEDLLDLSRIASGKIRLNARPTEIVQPIEAAVDALRPLVRDKGLNLITEFQPGADAIILGDADRLQQVFWNLLTNAAKFTPQGGTITVRLTRDAHAARLSVTDSGEGIDPQFLPHVFDRFRQADSSSCRQHGGLGIGLTIVHHIVSLHSGSVRAESAGKGHGATFTVTLPLALAEQLPAAAMSGPRAAVQTLPSIKGLRVLVVDDDADAREVMAEILKRHEANVTSAGSVAEAMRLFTASRPDIVVTDLAMPEQDGFALLKAVRGFSSNGDAGTPVLALTAYARPEDRAQTFQAGFHGHLAKPVDPVDLITSIHRCANIATPHRSDTPAKTPVPMPA